MAQPQQLANMMCYLAHDCETCPVDKVPSQSECKRNLYEWLIGQEDKEFWRYLDVW